ncbi:NAD(P)-dependent oxidoreductase [Acuticoccus mangrovi]|uniref:3-phosphoglycerate dehydrogenase n=1 Tax=Acuticoccus mangrovi TaxID=2796142 RepID=A0A934IE25_9HYPH|nr:NAD(P)-dependent oxidoreductase [Acuticoccus mangrovi]MBJ3774874.1 hypothetical protein [Acuticoccus mangrovi]
MSGSDSARRPLVCVLDEIHPAAIARLAEEAEVRTPADGGRDYRDADAIIVRASPIAPEDVRAAKRLRVIGKHGAGTDNIPMGVAKEAGIVVHSTPGENAESVADLAVGMALGIIRNICGHTAALRAGAPLTGEAVVGYELAELKTGIIGFGAVGQAVARRLTGGFGSTVGAFDPGIAADAWPSGAARYETLDVLVEECGLVFLHAPLNAATRGLFDAAMLARMPKGAFLVNCARGGIVDEAALADALRSGHLGGAACDVFEIEPPRPDNPLLAVEGFLATSHLGASTHRGLARVGLSIANKVLATLADRA